MLYLNSGIFFINRTAPCRAPCLAPRIGRGCAQRPRDRTRREQSVQRRPGSGGDFNPSRSTAAGRTHMCTYIYIYIYVPIQRHIHKHVDTDIYIYTHKHMYLPNPFLLIKKRPPPIVNPPRFLLLGVSF